jgi:hypothetical protein
MLPTDFIIGHAGFWRQPKHDFFAYLIGWHYFLADSWRLPLLDVPAMGYPEGGNLIYSDGLPVAQLISKAIQSVSGWAINPFGWWVFLTYLLQGGMAARLGRAAGIRTPIGWIAAAILATASVPFMTRIFHVALSSHFLILWALSLYFEDTRDQHLSVVEHFCLGALTLLTNAYLFAMVGAIQAITIVVVWRRKRGSTRQLVQVVLGAATLFALAILIGYGRFVAHPSAIRASGFGVHSWNPATLVLPPPSHWDYLAGLPRVSVPEQLEGESYLGMGALLVLVTVCVARPLPAIRSMRRHWLLASLLLIFVLYASSNRIFLGTHLLLEVPLPLIADHLVGFFRASGRFIWVPLYALVVLSTAALLRWLPRGIAIPVVVIACALQLSEMRSTVRTYRPVIAGPSDDLLDINQFRRWMTHHRRLFQFPSFGCQPPRTIDETFRELQIELLAARLNVPNNSIYTARTLKNCQTEAAWMVNAGIDDGTLYVLKKSAVPQAPALTALAQSPFCVDVDWGLVCSSQPLRR